MFLEETEIYPEMDPRLQLASDRYRRDLRTMETATSAPDEIGVIALVSHPGEWNDLRDVRPVATVGQTADGWLVTGRIPMARIEAVRKAATVKSLKAGQRLRPVVGVTTEEIEADPSSLPAGMQSAGGAGAIVGFVDHGADFAHDNLRHPGGSSRLRAIWHQRGTAPPGSPVSYGRRYGTDEIDAALQAADPYAELGYGPAENPRGAHGTHVMDIAAGNGAGSGVPGVAPEASMIFVEPAASDIAWEGEDVVGAEFGDSVQLLESLRFIFDEAADEPCVVNVSLGTNGGPHDGTSLVEQGIDVLVRGAANRAVVIAASNSFEDGIHASGQIPAGESTDLRWVIPSEVQGQSELEVWYSGDDRFGLELVAPDGAVLGSVPLGSSGRVQSDDGTALLFVSHRADDPNNGDNVIGIFLERCIVGTWTVRLHGEQVTDGGFHAWIERNDPSQSAFEAPHDSTHTLGSISCGETSIVVGSYDAHDGTKPLSAFSSAGPTRDGREKPEVSAPGHRVMAARSRTRTGVTEKSGTSMAAPAVAGVVALVLAEARARGEALDADSIRGALIDTARSDPPPAGVWDDRYGNGRIHAAGALESLGKTPPAGVVRNA